MYDSLSVCLSLDLSSLRRCLSCSLLLSPLSLLSLSVYNFIYLFVSAYLYFWIILYLSQSVFVYISELHNSSLDFCLSLLWNRVVSPVRLSVRPHVWLSARLALQLFTCHQGFHVRHSSFVLGRILINRRLYCISIKYMHKLWTKACLGRSAVYSEALSVELDVWNLTGSWSIFNIIRYQRTGVFSCRDIAEV